MNEALKRLVWERAADACEYCRLPQGFDVLPFQIDHVNAEKHHGATVAENLALSCLNDNLHKFFRGFGFAVPATHRLRVKPLC